MSPELEPLLLAVAVLFALGAVAIALLGLVSDDRPLVRSLWRAFGQELLIVAPVVALVVSGPLVGCTLLAVLLARAGRELQHPLPNRSPAAPMIGWRLAVVAWVAATIALVMAHLVDGRVAAVLVVYAIVESADSAAYVAGKVLGGPAVFPRLSPRKTLGGLVAGLVTGTATGAALGAWVLDLPVPLALGVATTTVTLGLGGDLAVSWLKRGLAIKDFPVVLPGHGGVLDIYDSMLGALPGALLLLWLIG